MARRKVDKNETTEEKATRKKIEAISGHASRSEKTAWQRKYEKMQGYVEDIKLVEEKILDLTLKEKIPLFDAIDSVRKELIELCIHPYDEIVDHGDYLECKFCKKRIKISNGKK